MTPYNTKMWKRRNESWYGSYMIGVTQMIPNASRLKADSNYECHVFGRAENKNYTVNQLNALAKSNYYQWIVLDKNKIANDNLLLLEYMIKSMEIHISIIWTNAHLLQGKITI
jgi:hypothetical protein